MISVFFVNVSEPSDTNVNSLFMYSLSLGFMVRTTFLGFLPGHAGNFQAPTSLCMCLVLHAFVEQQGVQAIDKPARCMRRLHQDTVRREINFLGKQRGQDHVSVVRNVRFEPTRYPEQDVAGGALEQVAAAFRWRHPAVISSHRVNYCGHIDPENRSLGLAALHRLLHGIVQRWPDVIFIDTWARFSGRDGNWAEFVIDPRDGEGKDVRADDGFHLNSNGAEILALDIAVVIQDDLRARGAAI